VLNRQPQSHPIIHSRPPRKQPSINLVPDENDDNRFPIQANRGNDSDLESAQQRAFATDLSNAISDRPRLPLIPWHSVLNDRDEQFSLSRYTHMSESDVERIIADSNLTIAGSRSSEQEIPRTTTQTCNCKPGSILPPWHSVLGSHADLSSMTTSTPLTVNQVLEFWSSTEMVYTFVPYARLLASPSRNDEWNKIFYLSLSYGRYNERQPCEVSSETQKNFLEIQQIARLRFGRVISTEFPIFMSKVHLKCQYGHDWHAYAGKVIKDLQWCPTCDTPTSKFESICRQLLERMYGTEFRRIRPRWLLNEDTQYPLEIDCYNEGLKLGLEANGAQHYVTGIYGDYELLRATQDRDRKKAAMCEKLGIHLIVVPYTVKFADIQRFILDSLQKANRPPPPNTADIDITTLLAPEKAVSVPVPKKSNGKRKAVSQPTALELMQKHSRLAEVDVDHDFDADSDDDVVILD